MPGYQGRLIWPHIAVFRQLDTAATAADPDGAGPLTKGYDDGWDTPIVLDLPTRVSTRKEGPPLRIPVQVETEEFGKAEQMPSGTNLRHAMTLVAHFKDLRKLGLVDPETGLPTLQHGDRLEALKHKTTGELTMLIAPPHGLYVYELRPVSFGLSALTRNLLLIRLESRKQG